MSKKKKLTGAEIFDFNPETAPYSWREFTVIIIFLIIAVPSTFLSYNLPGVLTVIWVGGPILASFIVAGIHGKRDSEYYQKQKDAFYKKLKK